MAIRIRTKRLATSATNPRRVSRRPRSSNPKRRKVKLSPKQIRIFGTKRQKAALRNKRSTRSNARVVRSSRARNRAKRSLNPAWIVTVGQALNPRKRSSKMAAKKARKRRKVAAHRPRRRRVAKSNPTRRHYRRRRRNGPRMHRRRRRNAPRVVVRYRTRRRNGRRRHHTTHRNPEIFGSRLGSKDSLKLIGGGLAGVAATKFLPTLLPVNTLASVANTNLGKTAISLAAALASGWVASKLDKRFGDGVYFGGIMQAASVGLNAFVPSIYKTLGIGLGGVGDFVPGQFTVPQNPVRAGIAAPSAHMPAASGSRVTMSGLARAYAPAY